MAVAYRFVSANAKFQLQADDFIFSNGLFHLAVVPHLFYPFQNGALVLIVFKVVYDLKLTGELSAVQHFLCPLNRKFALEQFFVFLALFAPTIW